MLLPSGLSWSLHPLEGGGLESISECSEMGTTERVGKAEGVACVFSGLLLILYNILSKSVVK